jgi:hypothetical protein
MCRKIISSSPPAWQGMRFAICRDGVERISLGDART